jgi:alpha-galactosidase
VWPGAPGKKDPKLLLTPERERAWGFWLKVYQQKRLSEGHYLGELYDIGFDKPETHAISKGDRLYYALYAREEALNGRAAGEAYPGYRGQIELRGLQSRRYRVHDYETDRDLGVVTGPTAQLSVTFKRHLLLEAVPE